MENETASRQRVRQAALAIFARQGLAGLTMRAIATEAGVTPPALYRHYPNRNAILADVWETGFVDLARVFAEPIESEDCNERILTLTDRYIRWALDNPELFDLVYSYDVQLKRQPRAETGEQAAYAAMAILVKEVENCVRSGRWRSDNAWTLAVTVWGLGRGMFTLYRTRRIEVSADDMPELCRHSMRLLIEGLAVPQHS